MSSSRFNAAPRPMRGARGFTLVELMVTVAVVAILAMIALPSFSYTIRSNRITTATNNLLAAINQARGEAVSRARPVAVCASNADGTDCSADADDWGNGWLVVCTDTAGTQQGCVSADADDTGILRVFAKEEQVVITTTATNIIFTRLGAASATTTFELTPDGCANNQKREIEVTALGRSRSVEKECTA